MSTLHRENYKFLSGALTLDDCKITGMLFGRGIKQSHYVTFDRLGEGSSIATVSRDHVQCFWGHFDAWASV